jgi:hypothetical protein
MVPEFHQSQPHPLTPAAHDPLPHLPEKRSLEGSAAHSVLFRALQACGSGKMAGRRIPHLQSPRPRALRRNARFRGTGRVIPCSGKKPTAGGQRSPRFLNPNPAITHHRGQRARSQNQRGRTLWIALSGERTRLECELRRPASANLAPCGQGCSRVLRCQLGTKNVVAAGRCKQHAGRMCSPDKPKSGR